MRSLDTTSKPRGRIRAGAANLVRLARGATATNGFSPLIDAKAAGQLLGVPHTWLLAQARAGRIPHHRLGHYVRFNADDLACWLEETRSGPHLERSEPRDRP